MILSGSEDDELSWYHRKNVEDFVCLFVSENSNAMEPFSNVLILLKITVSLFERDNLRNHSVPI